MAGQTERYRQLWSAAEHLSGAGEADGFFADLERAVAAADVLPPDAATLAYTALRNLMDVTRGDAAAAAVITSRLLPACLSEPGGDDATPERRIHGMRLRELLHDWVERFPDEQRLPLRDDILARALAPAAKDGSKPALWTIADVGFRSRSVAEALWALAGRDDDAGDAAIDCLVALRPPDEQRDRLVRHVLDRLPRPGPSKFTYAIQELADPAFLPELERRATGAAGDERPFALELLARIADARPGDADLQGRAWAVIERAAAAGGEPRSRVLFSGRLTTNCDLPRPVRLLLDWLPTEQAGRYLVYHRLEECVRPNQLGVWADGLSPPAVAAVEEDATRPADPGVQQFSTAEHWVKRAAWDTALCAGLEAVAGWLSRAVADEPNPYVQHSVMDRAACVAVGELPDAVLRLVRERSEHGRGTDDPTLLARIAAAEVARSAATPESFDALLDCGFTLDGYPLRSTADAVADVAVALARGGSTSAAESLLRACERPEPPHRRLLAVRGLEGLGEAGLLPRSVADRLVRAAADDSLPGYARARLVATLGGLDGAGVMPDVVPLLLSIAARDGAEAELRYQSLDTLHRVRPWREHEPLYAEALGLAAAAGALRPAAPEGYTSAQGYLLGRLLPASPEILAAAAVYVVARGGGDAVHQLLNALLASVDALPASVREEVAVALVERIRRTQGRTYGDTGDLSALARLSPRLFVVTRWEDHWGEWMPAVRVAFCDASRHRAVAAALVGDAAARAAQLLEGLLGDASFAVRRAAARSLARLDLGRLTDVCGGWERSGQTELCRRAAEAAGWLQLDRADTLDNDALRRLATHPEPSVRSAASAARTAARKRVWAAHCLDRVAAARDEPNHWVLGAYCYGQALTRLGDDEAAERLAEVLDRPGLPPNVRHWLGGVADDLEKGWKRAVQDWPEPWLPWTGRLEEVDGNVVVGDTAHATRFSLWQRPRRDPSDWSGWGGACRWNDGRTVFRLMSSAGDKVRFEIPGRRPATALFSTSGSDNTIVFTGTGPYPEPAP